MSSYVRFLANILIRVTKRNIKKTLRYIKSDKKRKILRYLTAS